MPTRRVFPIPFSDRFRERSRGQPKAADVLRADALEQVGRCWLGAPVCLDSAGRCVSDQARVINPVFRFHVFRSDKIRDIDDLRRGLVDRFCAIDPPNVLPSWGHIAELILPSNQTHREWDFIKGDNESAYIKIYL